MIKCGVVAFLLAYLRAVQAQATICLATYGGAASSVPPPGRDFIIQVSPYPSPYDPGDPGSGYLDSTGQIEPLCQKSSTFILSSGLLYAEGDQVSVAPGIPYMRFQASEYVESIDSIFAVNEAEGKMVWNNEAFDNDTARFCADETGALYGVFSGPLPVNCTVTELKVKNTASCPSLPKPVLVLPTLLGNHTSLVVPTVSLSGPLSQSAPQVQPPLAGSSNVHVTSSTTFSSQYVPSSSLGDSTSALPGLASSLDSFSSILPVLTPNTRILSTISPATSLGSPAGLLPSLSLGSFYSILPVPTSTSHIFSTVSPSPTLGGSVSSFPSLASSLGSISNVSFISTPSARNPLVIPGISSLGGFSTIISIPTSSPDNSSTIAPQTDNTFPSLTSSSSESSTTISTSSLDSFDSTLPISISSASSSATISSVSRTSAGASVTSVTSTTPFTASTTTSLGSVTGTSTPIFNIILVSSSSTTMPSRPGSDHNSLSSPTVSSSTSSIVPSISSSSPSVPSTSIQISSTVSGNTSIGAVPKEPNHGSASVKTGISPTYISPSSVTFRGSFIAITKSDLTAADSTSTPSSGFKIMPSFNSTKIVMLGSSLPTPTLTSSHSSTNASNTSTSNSSVALVPNLNTTLLSRPSTTPISNSTFTDPLSRASSLIRQDNLFMWCTEYLGYTIPPQITVTLAAKASATTIVTPGPVEDTTTTPATLTPTATPKNPAYGVTLTLPFLTETVTETDGVVVMQSTTVVAPSLGAQKRGLPYIPGKPFLWRRENEPRLAEAIDNRVLPISNITSASSGALPVGTYGISSNGSANSAGSPSLFAGDLSSLASIYTSLVSSNATQDGSNVTVSSTTTTSVTRTIYLDTTAGFNTAPSLSFNTTAIITPSSSTTNPTNLTTAPRNLTTPLILQTFDPSILSAACSQNVVKPTGPTRLPNVTTSTTPTLNFDEVDHVQQAYAALEKIEIVPIMSTISDGNPSVTMTVMSVGNGNRVRRGGWW